jgi:ribosome biogenesis GTPase
MSAESLGLETLGWDEGWSTLWARADRSETRGRVIRAGRLLTVSTGDEELLLHCPDGTVQRPVVGDWVAMTVYPEAAEGRHRAVLRAVLDRRNALVRRSPEDGGPQTILANLDSIWILCDLDRLHTLSSVTRYQALASLEKVTLTVVLNKADRARDLERHRSFVQERAPGLDVLTTSILEGASLEPLELRLRPRSTTALIGPSGAGKSSLVNALTRGAHQRTTEVRKGDRRGRHTTSAGEMRMTPSGALLIDTPGLREIGLWQSDPFERGFGDILEVAEGCRFRDCAHRREPGCQVRQALEDGRIASERFLAFLELEREQHANRRPASSKERRR